MTDKQLLGAGNVTVTLGDGEDAADYVLKPLPIVIKHLCAEFGGLRSCIQRVQDLDMNMMLRAVALATNVKGSAAVDLERRFYATPITGLIQPLTTHLLVLMNGGRPLTDGDEKKDDDSEAEKGNG